MDTLLRMIIPLLPAQAGEIADSLSPVLSLLSSPTQLIWYLYSNPSRILSILATSGGDLFNALRRLDFTSTTGDRSALGAILPFIVGAVGLYMAALSLMSTFRTAWAILRRLVRWGTTLAVIVGAFGLLTGRGGGGDQAGGNGGGGGGNALGTLMGLLGGNNAGGGGLYQQAFGVARNYAFGNNNGNNNNQAAGLASTLWNTFSNPSQQREAPISGRTRSSKSKKANADGDKLDVDGLTDMAQKFVKEAFLKENPLSSWLGTAEKSEAEKKRLAKEKAKKARGW